MRLDERSHEHAGSGQVFTYDGEYSVGPNEIAWRATVNRGADFQRELTGSVPVTSPGVALIAEEAVHDAIVKQIDLLEPGGTSA
ncbi:MAG TPA: hypothetical protein VGE16_00670 [Albitalea sp.]